MSKPNEPNEENEALLPMSKGGKEEVVDGRRVKVVDGKKVKVVDDRRVELENEGCIERKGVVGERARLLMQVQKMSNKKYQENNGQWGGGDCICANKLLTD